ncbi:hypothetical protein GTW51_19050 [Aurantimonas aggregata]|uniref:Rho termination factor N-terminal domain-containing protein n=1 Tax=Aurantimonas aggregata TaxID=2047720 RepID=A0A6L9MLT1_9HYPH|nr:hypothetical protein [Aurantimonas aggregata]NDV88797.1 hypothetical protein [Aurantimonas aggregata]
MQVKNKKSGEVETMRYGAAAAAVSAGTHKHVNVDADKAVADPSVQSQDSSGNGSADLSAMTKDELVAEAEKRGVEVKAGDTKAEIIKALEAQ